MLVIHGNSRPPRGPVQIGKSDQGNAQVSSIHGACVSARVRAGGSLQSSALPAALAPLRCPPPRRLSDPARPDLLQLPERADEARAEAEDDEQQQEGLIDGRDVYHGDDEATPVPGVPARTALVGPQCVVNGGGASGATSKAPRWNSSPTVSCGSECCASSVNAA